MRIEGDFETNLLRDLLIPEYNEEDEMDNSEKENDEIIQGDRFGMIRFGSRIDIYFENYQLMVNTNQKTIAGETIIAKRK